MTRSQSHARNHMAVMGSGFDGPSFILANPDSAFDRY